MPSGAIEIETPPIGLESVPVEVVVANVAPGASVALNLAGATYLAAADESGVAVFSEALADATGIATIEASVTGQSASAEIRILPGWISLLPAAGRPVAR